MRAHKSRTKGMDAVELELRDSAIDILLLDGHGEACVGRGFNLSRQRIHQMRRGRLGISHNGVGHGRPCPHPSHYFPMGPEGSPKAAC